MLSLWHEYEKISNRDQEVIEVVKQHQPIAFGAIFKLLPNTTSERTVKRNLADLVKADVLKTSGGGRSLVYEVTVCGRLFVPVHAEQYNEINLDARQGVLETYQFELWKEWPIDIFSESECASYKPVQGSMLNVQKINPLTYMLVSWNGLLLKCLGNHHRSKGIPTHY